MHFSASCLLSFNVISTKGLKKIVTQMRKIQLKYKYYTHHEIQSTGQAHIFVEIGLGLYWDILAPKCHFIDTLVCIPRSHFPRLS